MLLRPYRGVWPKAAPSARGADNISLIGDVTVGEMVSLWYGCVLRGDVSPISVGDGSNIQDGCVLHGAEDLPTVVGRNVVVGHNATVHGCVVEDGCLIGMGATLLNGCRIGAGSIIGAGALVSEGKVIPPRSLVLGVPGRVVRTVTEEEAASILVNALLFAREWRPELEEIRLPRDAGI